MAEVSDAHHNHFHNARELTVVSIPDPALSRGKGSGIILGGSVQNSGKPNTCNLIKNVCCKLMDFAAATLSTDTQASSKAASLDHRGVSTQSL